MLKDITEYKEAMELIRQTQKQLVERERLASLGELASGVAHDINTPLSTLQSCFYLINEISMQCIVPDMDESLKNKIELILENAKDGTDVCAKIAKIVNSVRNHTRNLSGENIQEFYVINVLEDLNILLNHQLKQSDCELIINENDKTLIKGDPGKLSQVLTNIITNAVQAYNGKPGIIESNIDRKDNKLIISVSDNAGRIPKDFQGGIFKNILTTKGTQGTGLGLYFSYSIITGHFGGDMWFETEEGKGTTFYIKIPINKNY